MVVNARRASRFFSQQTLIAMSEQNNIDADKIVIAIPPGDDPTGHSPAGTGSEQWEPVLAD